MVNWLRKVDAVLLNTAKEEGLVFLDRPPHFETILAHPDQRLAGVLRVSEKLVRVQGLIAKEEEARAMKFARAASRRNRDRCSAVAAFFSSGIVGGHFEFLNIVGIDAVKITNRVGN